MSQHALILSHQFLFPLSCSSIPQCHTSLVSCVSFSCSLSCLFSLLVHLSPYVLLLWLAPSLCTLSCTFAVTQSDLICIFSLHILTSFPLRILEPSIEAFSFNFKFYIVPYVLHLESFVDQSYTLQRVMCLLFLYVSYTMHLCVASLLNPSCKFINTYVLHL